MGPEEPSDAGDEPVESRPKTARVREPVRMRRCLRCEAMVEVVPGYWLCEGCRKYISTYSSQYEGF